jgi:hypothetical protein
MIYTNRGEGQMSDKKEIYKVKLEIMAPIEVNLKVWATSPEEAVEIAKLSHIQGAPKIGFSRMKKLKATVYKWMYNNVLLTKKY